MGKLSGVSGRAVADLGLGRRSGLVGGGLGYAVIVTAKSSVWICRMWFFSLRSVSRRAW
jgi:hypothetical protein